MLRFFVLILPILISTKGFSQQYEFPDERESFIQYLDNTMQGTKVESAMYAGKTFHGIWNSGTITATDKEVVIQQFKRMAEKGFKARPHFETYLSSICKGIHVTSTEEMSEYIRFSSQVIERYNGNQLADFWGKTSLLFDQSALYSIRYNKLYVNYSDIHFEFANPQLPDKAILNREEDKPLSLEQMDLGVDMPERASIPEIKGATVRFDKTGVVFSCLQDTAKIYDTKGAFLTEKNLFIGKGGKFTWFPIKQEENRIYVTFSEYFFDVSKPRLHADEVKMTHRNHLEGEVKGVFDYKAERVVGNAKRNYPRFKSYKKNYEIKNIGDDNLFLFGGFSMVGKRITTDAVLDGTSHISYRQDGEWKFKAWAPYFTIEDDSIIRAENARVILYHEEDSITHIKVRFKYEPATKRLVLLKDQGRFKETPYLSTFFNMYIYADMLDWNMDSKFINFNTLAAKSRVPVIFESQEHFTPKKLKDFNKIYPFNPALMVVGYSRQIHSTKFLSSDMANHYKVSPQLVATSMKELKAHEIIDYDETTDQVVVLKKAVHFYLSGRGKKDYDDLIIPSVYESGANASLNVDTGEIIIRGIEEFYISEELNVYIHPKNEEIRLKKNRDFEFDGQLYAGLFEYAGRDFLFKYDSFNIAMDAIDSISFYVEKDIGNGNKTRTQVDNKIVGADLEEIEGKKNAVYKGMKGSLYINRPDNKSAKINYPRYPQFNSVEFSLIFFDKPFILDNAYDKSIFFVVSPFSTENLNNKDSSVVNFDGKFVSGNIFPNFNTNIHVMPDNSLGFEYDFSKGVFLYESIGEFFGTITMDKGGLRGKGRIEFMNTTLESENFIFYKDSVVTYNGSKVVTRSGDAGGGTIFPEFFVHDYNLKWDVNTNNMSIFNNETPFQFYNKTASMYGTAIVGLDGVRGEGKMLTRGSETRSNQFSFKETEYSARDCYFEIKSDNPQKPALLGEDVSLSFYLEDAYADISPEKEGSAVIKFPYAQFNTSIPNARWNLTTRKVSMVKPPQVGIDKSYFYSTLPEMDSLAFSAASAEYDINNLILKVFGIPYIISGDAKIIPDQNQLYIQENSKIDRLDNCELEVDVTTGYHHLFNGTINIISRNDYTGAATYKYHTEGEDTFYLQMKDIKMVPIQSNQRRKTKLAVPEQTFAYTNISEEMGFKIHQGFLYKGDVSLYATRKSLLMDGQIKLELDLPYYDTWFYYENSEADQQEIRIPYDQIKPVASDAVFDAGLFYDHDNNSVYISFFSDLIPRKDIPIMRPEGELYYDPTTLSYCLNEGFKLTDENFSGSSITLHKETLDMSFEGKFFLAEPDENFVFDVGGKASSNLLQSRFKMQAFVVLNYNIHKDAIEKMYEDVIQVKNQLKIPVADSDQPALIQRVSELIGDELAMDYEKKSRTSDVSLISMSSYLEAALVLSKVNLKWSTDQKAWYSDRGKLGISNIGKGNINAELEGFLELRKTEEGDVISFFFKVASDCWYWGSYHQNEMKLYSSNYEFNKIIIEKSKASKVKRGEFLFTLGDDYEVSSFVNEFRKEYYGIREQYQLDFSILTEQSMLDNKEEALDEIFEETEEPPALEEEEEEEKKEETDNRRAKRKKRKNKSDDSEKNIDSLPQPDPNDDEGF